MSHVYDLETEHGRVQLTTHNDHSRFQSIHDFIHHHQADIATALGVVGTAITIYSVFHGNRRLK